MALAFPLPITGFFNLLPIEQISFDCPEQNQESQTGKGERMSAELAPMLWTAEIKLGPMMMDETAQIDTLLDVLRAAGRMFFAYDPRRRGPLADPTGLILGAAVPVIASMPNARDLTISGLPVGYQLSAGDYLAFDYGGRRALHRLVSGGVASVGGVTPVMEVTPAIRPGAAISAPIGLIRASCKATLAAASISKGHTRNGITRDMSFRLQQTLGI